MPFFKLNVKLVVFSFVLIFHLKNTQEILIRNENQYLFFKVDFLFEVVFVETYTKELFCVCWIYRCGTSFGSIVPLTRLGWKSLSCSAQQHSSKTSVNRETFILQGCKATIYTAFFLLTDYRSKLVKSKYYQYFLF